jgi:hypothetical protein
MIKINLLTVTVLLTAMVASPAYAGVPRAWVSGHGTDASGCGSPADPCRSLQYVHDNIIEAGGEIDILDPAGYGTITITKAISIVNDGVGTAGVQQGTAGQNAITINAGSTDAVTLRGLNIDGLGVAYNGIVFNSGASLTVVNCVIRHFANGQTDATGNGILIEPSSGTLNFLVSNTIAADNANTGLYYLPPSGNANVNGVIDHVTAINNQYGIGLNAYLQTGGTTYFSISNSIGSNNGVEGLLVANGSDLLTATVDMSTFNNNEYGIYAGNSVVLLLGRSVITSNKFGIYSNVSSSTLYTYGDNRINKNSVDISGTALNTSFKPQ